MLRCFKNKTYSLVCAMKTQYPQTNKISRLFSMYIFKELEQRI